MYKKGETVKISALERELQTLRKGSGISSWKLAGSAALRKAIARQTSTEPSLLTDDQLLDYLQNEAEKLGNSPEGQALRNALGFGMKDNPGQLTLRRNIFAKKFGKHSDTVEMYENRGIKIIVERLSRPPTFLSSSNSRRTVMQPPPVPTEYPVAHNMLTQGLGDLFGLGPHASEIMRLFGGGETPHLNADVEIILLPSERGKEWYTYKLHYVFQSDITHLRIGLVPSSYESDVLMASHLVDDTVKVDAGTDLEEEIDQVLAHSYLIATKNHVRHTLHFQRLSAEARAQLLEGVWQIEPEACEIMELEIPEALRGDDVIYEQYWHFDLNIHKGRYIYWSAPRLTYLNNVTVDATRFPNNELYDFYSYSFLGPTFPGMLEQATSRYTIPAHTWVVQGHGLMLVWQRRD